MFDVSYKHVAGLAAAAKAANSETTVILGGAAVTTAWDVILSDQPSVDALCYSEGELALVKLLDSDDLQKELLTDPWVTRQSIAEGRKPKTKTLENLNDVIAIDYSLIDTDEYGMIEAFSPFVKRKRVRSNNFSSSPRAVAHSNAFFARSQPCTGALCAMPLWK